MLWLEITISGRSCHAAMPQKGINALELGFAYAMELKALIEMLFPKHPVLGNNSCSLTMVQGGVKVNVIPDILCWSEEFWND
jgi:succinyl-diaminopimelate desuccinylase